MPLNNSPLKNRRGFGPRSRQLLQGQTVVGLDIGTTKVCCLVAEERDPLESAGDRGFAGSTGRSGGPMKLLGVGHSSSRGIKKGLVVNLDAIAESVSAAVKDAELMSGRLVTHVTVGVAGSHVRTIPSISRVSLPTGQVTEADLSQALALAKEPNAETLAEDREILHSFCRGFRVDGGPLVLDPLGTPGKKLECHLVLATASTAAVEDIRECVRRAGYEAVEVVIEPIASAEAVLTTRERGEGVALIDIGGGTTDIAVFSSGCLISSSAIGIGGNHLTHDISIGLRTTADIAEILKVRYGSAISSRIHEDEVVHGEAGEGREATRLSRRTLAKIIECRVEELLVLIHQHLLNVGIDQIGSVVFTGGTSLLAGFAEMAELELGLSVRVGSPRGASEAVGTNEELGKQVTPQLKGPQFATAVGLVRIASRSGAASARIEQAQADRKLGVRAWMSQHLKQLARDMF